MLLYVDKKKLKRQRLKRLLTILFIVVFIGVNIVHFKQELHHSNQKLTTYNRSIFDKEGYAKADTVLLFASKSKETPSYIVIPPIFNRQNYQTIALAFSLLSPGSTEISFLSDVPNQDHLLKLGQIFHPDLNITSDKSNIIVTTNFNAVAANIRSAKLIPNALNYARAAKTLSAHSVLAQLLKELFPTPIAPQTRLQKEQQALKNFTADYKKDILQLINNTFHPASFVPIPYAAHSILLKNVSVCLKSSSQTACVVNSKHSLMQNIATAGKKLSALPEKLILLTSTEPILSPAELQPDDGLGFHFKNQRIYIIPEDLPQSTNAFKFIKKQAGLNPDYESPAMKFYKFKTTEIPL